MSQWMKKRKNRDHLAEVAYDKAAERAVRLGEVAEQTVGLGEVVLVGRESWQLVVSVVEVLYSPWSPRVYQLLARQGIVDIL